MRVFFSNNICQLYNVGFVKNVNWNNKNISTYFSVWKNDVSDTEKRNTGEKEKDEGELFPQTEGLEETHLRPVPEGGHVLLAIGMGHKL